MSNHPNKLELYRTMLLIRTFEERIEKLFSEGKVKGTCHLYVGQEAVAVGACSALAEGDYAISTHRGHGHFIAMGGDPGRILAEMFGRATGYSRGRGGSQHMADFSIGFLGSNGITAGGTPIGTGAALRLKQTGRPNVVIAFMGDGATNQGVFYEAVNMAATWSLPAIYVCENNHYGMSTPIERVTAVDSLAKRVAGFGVDARRVDGNDAMTVHEAVAAARERAVAGEGPQFLECETYRFCGHSRGDQRVYRTREEEARWQAQCPLPRLEEQIKSEGLATDDDLQRIRTEVDEAMQKHERFALDSPPADVNDLNDPVFAP